MAKKTVLISAGPTRERIDPVRFISNYSTGYLGLELAREAKRLGFKVILVLGPTLLPQLKGVETHLFETAKELEQVLKKHIRRADYLFMTSAVCDFSPEKFSSVKIKRQRGMTLQLKSTHDVLKGLSPRKIKKNKVYIGFCLETSNLIKNAERKLKSKRLDFIVGTQKKFKQMPFGKNAFKTVILDAGGKQWNFPKMEKDRFAKRLFRLILNQAK